MTPLITVAMAARNAERYLAEAIESILQQTMGDFEFFIADDASTDGTRALIRQYAQRDRRIRPLLGDDQRRLAGRMNQILGLARGTYFARMDADDRALPQRFARQVAFLERHREVAAVGSAVTMIDEDGDPICRMAYPSTEQGIFDHLRAKCTPLCHPSAVIRKAAMERIGGYDERFQYAEDYDFWMRLSETAPLANADDILLEYRIHCQSLSHRQVAQLQADVDRAHREASVRRGWSATTLPSAPSPALTLSEAVLRRKLVLRSLRGGHLQTAWKHFRRLWREAPASRHAWKACLYLGEGLVCLLPGVAASRRRRLRKINGELAPAGAPHRLPAAHLPKIRGSNKEPSYISTQAPL